MLFEVGVPAISKHLKNIFDGKVYNTQYYSLDAVISVGYRVNSLRATQFRQWTTNIIRQFAIRGYVIDKKRMEDGTFIGQVYFEHLLA